MPKYQVTYCTMAEADDAASAVELIKQVIAEDKTTPRVTLTEYPDDPELKEYLVYEEQTYRVMATSGQDAIDQVISDNNNPKFWFNVTERYVSDGPEGWQDEEYESP